MLTRLLWLASSLSLAACGFGGRSGVDAGDLPDSAIDGPPVPGCVSWTPVESAVTPCAGLGTPISLRLDANATFDTASGMLDRGGPPTLLPGVLLARTGAPSLRVVNLAGLTIDDGRTLRLVGAPAVLFVVHGAVRVAGAIDASATVAQVTPAPGAGSTRCSGPRAAGSGDRADGNNRGGGGGGGGGLGSDGGGGGLGFDDLDGGSLGAADVDSIPLRGGCAGGRGGDNDLGGGNEGGLGGGGGGGFAISARDAIAIERNARLLANGGPGFGGMQPRAGGGGGGAGGTILLDGAEVTVAVDVQLCAKGGGGGEGSGLATGARGQDVDCATARSAGGAGGSGTGGDGGDGGARTDGKGALGADGLQSGGDRGGGGGGGGGAGKILMRARSGAVTVSSPMVSPPHATI